MPIDVTLPRISEDEAYNILTSALRHSPKAGEKVALTDIITKQIERYRPENPGRMVMYQYDPFQPNAAPFYSATWRLCNRGILAQAPSVIQPNYGGLAGTHFIITEYGAKWLSGLSDYDCVPMEYGRFSQLLSNHARRLGQGYHSRSQEAVSCYRAQTYLACCAMSGAAAESIMLALAIAKNGDEEAVLKDYGSSGGRGKIERFLLSNQDAHITRNLPNYTSLLNDWRDVAAHGDVPIVGEEEAFTALMLLLRFARFAEERWEDITSPRN
jgi:hypothetical protein